MQTRVQTKNYKEMGMNPDHNISLTINENDYHLLVEPRWSLLYVLREVLGLTATKIGCGRGECGACTVLINDIPYYACMLLAVGVQNKKITTLEGLMDKQVPGTVQQAFAKEDAYQCGYCTPGQIMAAEGLLRNHPDPDLHKIRVSMSGNLCRCGAYPHIFKAVARAAEQNKTLGRQGRNTHEKIG